MPAGTLTLYKLIGYVYKIQHKSNNNLKKYYGSTVDMKQRKTDHKSSCNNSNGLEYDHQKYQYIRDNGGWENFKLIKIYQGEDDLLKESEFIKSTWEINTNCHIPLRTEEERKEYNIKRLKEYYEDNKAKINKVCVCQYCGKNYTYVHKKRHESSMYCRQFQE